MVLALTPHCHLESRMAIKAPCQVIWLKRTNRLCFQTFLREINEEQITYLLCLLVLNLKSLNCKIWRVGWLLKYFLGQVWYQFSFSHTNLWLVSSSLSLSFFFFWHWEGWKQNTYWNTYWKQKWLKCQWNSPRMYFSYLGMYCSHSVFVYVARI